MIQIQLSAQELRVVVESLNDRAVAQQAFAQDAPRRVTPEQRADLVLQAASTLVLAERLGARLAHPSLTGLGDPS